MLFFSFQQWNISFVRELFRIGSKCSCSVNYCVFAFFKRFYIFYFSLHFTFLYACNLGAKKIMALCSKSLSQLVVIDPFSDLWHKGVWRETLLSCCLYVVVDNWIRENESNLLKCLPYIFQVYRHIPIIVLKHFLFRR